MLEQITSRQLTEWQAYEMVAGAVDERYDSNVLADIHEQLQQLNHLIGAAYFTEDDPEDNPIRKPSRYPRPDEMYQPEDDDEEE